MRILLLTHRIPFPPNKGDKIRSFNLLKHLAGKHEVHVASLVDDARDLQYVGEMDRLAKSFLYADISGRSRVGSTLRALASGAAVSVVHFHSAELQQRIDALLDSMPFDAVLCFSSPTAEYVFRSRHAEGRLRNMRRAMDFIDVDSFKWAQYADQSRVPMSWIYRYESRQLARYEERIAREFHRLFLVTEQEKRLLPAGVPREQVSALGNGVDLEYFAPLTATRDSGRKPTLVFTGAMDYWPNIDGVQWFVEDIYPRIQRVVPDVAFKIVGSRPAPQVLKLAATPGVTVTGFVPDIRQCIAEADVCVVPLRIARGIQNKVLEAMAMGRPVVSTGQAFEGIRAREGEDVVVATGADEFAAAVIALLNEPARAEAIGRRARVCVENEYSWSSSLRDLDVLIQQQAVGA
ncbi:MAG: TIGR03087 family PEP-CTERM/XrtA system glycosyltransferase [Gammaproteobacteria bacterium]